MEDILPFIVIGLIAGWLAGVLVRGGGFGILGDIVVGVLGAVIGGYVFGRFAIGGSGILGEILIATAGAVLLIFLLRLIRRV